MIGRPAASVYPAFRAAIEVMHETGLTAEATGTTRLRRRMVERVLTSLRPHAGEQVEPLMTLLRRYATEARARKRACSAMSLPTWVTLSRRTMPDDPWCGVGAEASRQAFASPGASVGDMISSRYSGRSRFSCTRNSSVT